MEWDSTTHFDIYSIIYPRPPAFGDPEPIVTNSKVQWGILRCASGNQQYIDAEYTTDIPMPFDKVDTGDQDGENVDVIISDMASNTSGNKNLDSHRTGELCLKAMDLALKILHRDGVFLSKLFMGSVFNEINKKANKYFRKVVKYKPLSSRKESREIYIFCKGISNFI